MGWDNLDLSKIPDGWGLLGTKQERREYKGKWVYSVTLVTVLRSKEAKTVVGEADTIRKAFSQAIGIATGLGIP